MALGAYESELGRGSVLSAIAHPQVVDPAGAILKGVNAAKGITDLKQSQFNLQQAQLAPTYQAMRMLGATNSDPSYEDVTAALGGAARIGGNVDGVTQNLADWTARGGKVKDFVRAYALGGMSPENQALMGIGSPVAQDTGAGTVYGMRGGVLSAAPGQVTPNSFIGRTLSPTELDAPVTIPDPTGVGPPVTMSKGEAIRRGLWTVPGVTGGGAPGAGGGGGGGGGGSVAPTSSLGAQSQADFIQKFTPIAQDISQRTGLPVNYVLAQAGMETGWGTSRAAGNNNFFGISPGGQLASYATPQAGADAYVALMNSPRYANVARSGSPAQIGTAMAAAGYNPNPDYGARVGNFAGAVPAQTAAASPGGQQGGPFLGATSAVPVTGGGAVAAPGAGGGANVRPAGGFQSYDAYGRPTGGGGGGGPGPQYPPSAGGYPGNPYGQGGGVIVGQPAGTSEVIQGAIQRQQALQAQVTKSLDTLSTLRGMETDLNNMPTSGVAAGPLATIKNAIVSSGFASQQTVDAQSKGLAAQEQFDKFSSMLNQQLLASMGGQATDARQELTGAATPSSIHSKLGNLGIIHMLEGNINAMQAMQRAFRQDVAAGRASPQGFDQWRDNFTAPQKDGSRFDPRVFWIANMNPAEQRLYIGGLDAKDRTQLLKNSNYAEQQNWVFENKDGSMGTSY